MTVVTDERERSIPSAALVKLPASTTRVKTCMACSRSDISSHFVAIDATMMREGFA
jgi:hypothetical protein